MKIIDGIKPKARIRKINEGSDGGEEADITLKDFIKIFKKDAVGDHMMVIINKEIEFRKK